ncbi:GntR family transcriptional repressor for pyruvate dehydrogenase complex [Catalinimonas alkaloidigena]|uniref:FadR/GntR family transcriptional regulator n=1 Tax=Catalinimonas alkaloidigena TaxID=1075417 RepID=UPI002405E30C|nr:FadR/GntR family transcriptional regulator [Catalinimonas alkaloidigena]MDF9799272.1 GntR family transcriptional repressor for pyruvate dehydrogenase complex [Catalinimonas alkaloidigena]
MKEKYLNTFKEIILEKPVDKIIQQIKELISSGQLKPGDKLPSERALSELLGVGRSHVRDAIRKLEFYGILKTLPQSGTVVAGLGITALEGLITDVLQMEGRDFYALVETRVLLETNAARFAALRRSDDDIVAISNSLSDYEKAVSSGGDSVEYDLLFHLKIAEASKNPVLKSLMLIITPDILTHFKKNNVCAGNRPVSALEEHYKILDHIKKKNSEKAAESMRSHLQEILNFSTNENPLEKNNGKRK